MDHDEKITEKSSEFLLECYYRASVNLGLAEQTKIARQIKRK